MRTKFCGNPACARYGNGAERANKLGAPESAQLNNRAELNGNGELVSTCRAFRRAGPYPIVGGMGAGIGFFGGSRCGGSRSAKTATVLVQLISPRRRQGPISARECAECRFPCAPSLRWFSRARRKRESIWRCSMFRTVRFSKPAFYDTLREDFSNFTVAEHRRAGALYQETNPDVLVRPRRR